MYTFRYDMRDNGTGISCDPTPGSAATLPMPGVSCDPTHKNSMEGSTFFYLYQGSVATLPDFSVKNPTGFCTVSRSFRFKYSIPSINFSPPPLATHALRPYLTTFPPPWQPMLSMIQVQVQHSFYQIFHPPLATHALRPYLTTFLLSNFPPSLPTHAFNDSSSSTTDPT